MTKAAKEKEKSTRRRAATAALTSSFGPEAAAAVTDKKVPATAYGVYVDSQGVPYLKVEETKQGGRYVINAGSSVEVVELEAKTVTSRALELVPEASVLAAAKILLKPLTNGITISERAKKYLEQITADPNVAAAETEKQSMAKKKKAAKKDATRAAASAKSGSNGTGRGRPALALSAVITLKKGPKEDSIKRHVDFLTTLKEDGNGKMTLGDLAKAFSKRVKSKQDPVKVFSMHRKALTEGGFITVSEQA